MTSPQRGGKSHYTVDEMVERMKDVQAAKEGRSRRRRSNQRPRRARRKVKWIVAGIALVLVATIAAAAFLIFSNTVRYQSDSFRRESAARLAELFGMQVELAPIDGGGLTFELNHVRAAGGEDDFLRRLDARSVRAHADLPSLWSDAWQLKRVTAHRVDAQFLPLDASGESADAAGAPAARTAGFGLSSRPETVTVAAIGIERFSARFGEMLPAVIRDARFSGSPVGSSLEFSLSGGTAQWLALPPLTLTSGRGKFEADVLEIRQARASFDGGGEIEFSGRADVSPRGDVAMAVSGSEIAVDPFLSDYWAAKMSGHLSFAVDFSDQLGDPSPGVLRGTFVLSNGSFRGMPALDYLAILTAEPSLSSLEFPALRGAVDFDGSTWTFSDFSAAESGTVRFDGEIRVGPGREFTGALQLGIPSTAFNRLGPAKPSFLVSRSDGFDWMAIQFSGTVDSPVDDLTPKLRQVLTSEGNASRPPPSEPGAAFPVIPAPAEPAEPVPDPTPAPSDGRDAQLEEMFDALIR